MNNDSLNFPVILLVTTHRQLGPVVVPRKVGLEKSGWLSLQNNPIRDFSPGNGTENQEFLHEIISLSQSFGDNEIHRRFARKGILLNNFLKNIPHETLSLQIRPFIDQQMDKMFRMAMQQNIPVYADEGSQRVYAETRMRISMLPAEPWFCFTKTNEGSIYVLEIFQDDEKLILNSIDNKIFCNKPCWFKAGNRLIHFAEGFNGKKIEPFLRKGSIQVPATAEKKYFETFILGTLKTGQVKAEGFSVQTVEPLKQMELSVEVDWQWKAVLVVYFRYGEKRVMAGKSQRTFIDMKMEGAEVAFYKMIRQRTWEEDMISRMRALGLSRINENTLSLPGASGIGNLDLYRLVEWLNSHSVELEDADIMISTDRSPIPVFTGSVTADIKVVPGEDWFDVKAVVFFGDLEVPFIQLRHHLLEGIREFSLPGGEVAVLPWEWFTRYSDLFYYAEMVGAQLRLQLLHVQLIRELVHPENQILSERLKELDPESARSLAIPETLQATLRPYQTEGFQWLRFLHDNRFGGCLADDMGLGKTIQTLVLLLSCNMQSHAASLIVMPASLIHNWRNEIRKFAPSLRVLEHTGNQRMTSTEFFASIDVALTTYGTLRNDLELFITYRFHYIILDESQIIKNPSAQISQAVCRLNSDHRLVLTGTPVENSLTDLWSQMEFLNPGLLGPLAAFQKRYGLIRSQPTDATKVLNPTLVRKDLKNPHEITSDEEHGKQEVRLKRLIAPFILRRTKGEVEPDLPPLTLKEWYCEMTDEHRSRYEKEKSAVRNEMLQQIETGGSSETSLATLKALIRLRQVANHPCLVDAEYKGDSGKFEEIVRTTGSLRAEGHKTLIFSSFVKHLQLVADYFDREKINYSMLIGATRKREGVIKKFQENQDHQFFLISLKAGGTGLNLTEAGYVMLLDPWWNPAAELQAINRSHRIGQNKKVIAYRFITSGSIEEKMLVLQRRKQLLSDTFIPSGNPLKDLSQEEISDLFS